MDSPVVGELTGVKRCLPYPERRLDGSIYTKFMFRRIIKGRATGTPAIVGVTTRCPPRAHRGKLIRGLRARYQRFTIGLKIIVFQVLCSSDMAGFRLHTVTSPHRAAKLFGVENDAQIDNFRRNVVHSQDIALRSHLAKALFPASDANTRPDVSAAAPPVRQP
jgi:hypothetical protein